MQQTHSDQGLLKRNIQQKTTKYERSKRQMIVNSTRCNNQHGMNDSREGASEEGACCAHSASPQSIGHHRNQMSHHFSYCLFRN